MKTMGSQQRLPPPQSQSTDDSRPVKGSHKENRQPDAQNHQTAEAKSSTRSSPCKSSADGDPCVDHAVVPSEELLERCKLLEERLAASERHCLQAQSERALEAEKSKEHLDVLEETLRREERRRREAEDVMRQLLEKPQEPAVERCAEAAASEATTRADEEEPAFGRNPSSTTAAEEGHTEAEVEEEDHQEQERLDEDKEEEEEHEEHRSFRKLAGQENDLESQLALLREREEAAQAELEGWRRWADEQNIRELKAEAMRFDEIQRLKDDLARRIEEAKKEDAEENASLKRKLQKLEATEVHVMKVTRLEAEVSHWKSTSEEIQASLDDLEEEKEKLERQLKVALSDLEKAGARAAAAEDAAELERVGGERHRSAMQAEVRSLRLSLIEHRWRVLVQTMVSRADRSSADALRVAQTEEILKQDAETRALTDQNNELILSLEAAQEELTAMQSEVDRMSAREATFEGEFERMSERNALLGGHANQKQKIKHLMALKNENDLLRQDLRSTRQQLAQAEKRLRSAKLHDGGTAKSASVSMGSSPCPARTGNVTPLPARSGTQTPRPPSGLYSHRSDGEPSEGPAVSGSRAPGVSSRVLEQSPKRHRAASSLEGSPASCRSSGAAVV